MCAIGVGVMQFDRHLVGFLGKFGIAAGPAAKPDRVRALVRSLHPFVTEKPLVRIGGEGDGGYLVPDDFEGITACFSPGVSETATFEEDLARRGIPSFLADASVAAPPIENTLFHFTRKYLGVVEDDRTMPLDAWVRLNAPADGDLMLQMDIEGAEWEVLLNTSRETMRRFRIIVLEVHSIWQIVSRLGFQIINSTFEKLLQDFYVVHLHPNNVANPVVVAGISIPSLMEITLIRKDRVKTLVYATEFPHPLDRRNDNRLLDLVLPRAWYGGGV